MGKTIQERKQEGKEFRKTLSRSDLGVWKTKTDRQIVQELIVSQELTRVKKLIPLRRQRMAASPFSFFRGAAVIQAHDLAGTENTKFIVQACGDAHISNFGLFSSAERRLVFDINDCDETLPAPFDVDVKRLFASIEICGRECGFKKSQREKAVYEAAEMYRNTMRECSDEGNMEVWYKYFDVMNFMNNKQDTITSEQAAFMNATVEKALTKTSELAMKKLVEKRDGRLQIKSNPPLIVPVRELIGEDKEQFDLHWGLTKVLDKYKASLPEDRQFLIDQYKPLEAAHKVVGVGSVGRQAWITVLLGRENGDPLVLQVKEAVHSVLEDYYGASVYQNCGERVVAGQRAIQTAGDILLGWLSLKGPDGVTRDYYVRQLWDEKGSFELKGISQEGYYGLSLLCAWKLAVAHAKTGDRHAISGYLGKSDKFETAMVKYAAAYADQNEADYETFLKFSKDML